jgi:hypothetical protein
VENQTSDYYGTAKEILSEEDTRKLVAIAEVTAADADCALISVGGSHGAEGINDSGVSAKLYAGTIDTQKLNVFRPSAAALAVLNLTGAEIRELQEGGLDLNESGNPYEYCLFTKDDMDLQDDTTYRLVTTTDELVGIYKENAEELDISPVEAIAAYTTQLGEFGAEDIQWN